MGTWGTSEDLSGKETINPRLKSISDGPPLDDLYSSHRADFAFTSADDGPRLVIPFVERYCGEDKDHLPVYKREGLDAIARELGVSTGFSTAIVKSKCGEWERLWAGVKQGDAPRVEYRQEESRGPVVLSDWVPKGTISEMPHLLI